MKLITLGELPVGVTFVRHDEWGDKRTLYVKLTNHSFSPSDTTAYQCGTVTNGRTGSIVATVQVQQIEIGEHLEAVAFCLASALQDRHIS